MATASNASSCSSPTIPPAACSWPTTSTSSTPSAKPRSGACSSRPPSRAKERFDPEADAALVLADRGWHKGVVGIVAGRLAERWHRPVVMIARDPLQGGPRGGQRAERAGVRRARGGSKACGKHLLGCGGHAAAAGLQVDDARIDDFRQAFVAEVAARMPAQLRRAQIAIDGETTLGSLTLDTVEQLEKLLRSARATAGPVLCASGVTLAEPARTMGQSGKHLQLQLRQHAARIRGVAFGAGDWLPHLPPPGQPFHIAFRPKINEFRGAAHRGDRADRLAPTASTWPPTCPSSPPPPSNPPE
jgi:single-stranded-DNA-specific exonuclease